MNLKSITFPGLEGEYGIPDPSNFAPAGYGLGKDAKWVANRNAINACGFYQMDGSGNDTPDGYSWFGVASKLYNNILVFTATRYDGIAVRSVNDGSGWQPWEWVTPPMTVGVEYRTTERFNGKVVYAKLIDFGAIPSEAGGRKDVTGFLSTHGVEIVDAIWQFTVSGRTYVGNIAEVERVYAAPGYSSDPGQLTLVRSSTALSSTITAKVLVKFAM